MFFSVYVRAAAEAAEALRLIAVVIKSGHQAMASNARSVDRTYITISRTIPPSPYHPYTIPSDSILAAILAEVPRLSVHLSRASANALLSRLLSIQGHKSSCFDSEIDRRQAAGKGRAQRQLLFVDLAHTHTHVLEATPLTLTETNHCCANKKSTAFRIMSPPDVLLCPPGHVFLGPPA